MSDACLRACLMTREALIERKTTDHVIGAFFEVYNGLGFGFLERIYADALEFELLARSRKIQREVAIPIWYKGKQLSSPTSRHDR